MQGRPQLFELTVAEDGDVSIVAAAGELDMREAQALVDAVASTPRAVVVDLTGCTFLSSAGLQGLLSSRRLLQARGERFAVAYAGRPGSVTRVFEVVGAEQLFPVFGSRADAIAHARSQDTRSGVDRRSG